MFTRIYWGLILVTIGMLWFALIVTVGSYDTAPQALYAAASDAAWSGQLALQTESDPTTASTGYYAPNKVAVASVSQIVQEVFDANAVDMSLVKSGYSGLSVQSSVQNGVVTVTASGTYIFPLFENAIQGLFGGKVGVVEVEPITVYASGS